MSYLIGLFANNLLPIFLIAGAGFWLTKKRQVDARHLSQVIFYLFTPCLIFDLLIHSQLSGAELLQMTAVVACSHAAVGIIAWLAGRALGFERSLATALIMAAMLPNAGNYGLATVKFAFGEEALAYASLYFTISSIVFYTAGVFVASMGKSSPRQALVNLTKVPAVYAVVLGMFVARMEIQLPVF